MRLILVVCLTLFLAGCGRQVASLLPTAGSITDMRARLYSRSDSEPRVQEFSIAVHDYGKVLSLFADGKIDHFAAKWVVLGSVTIKSRSAPERTIDLYETHQDRGAFSIDGTYYRGSNDGDIIAVLNQCRKEAPPQEPDSSNQELKATAAPAP